MSLVIATFVPEGIVMASDSRQSLTIQGTDPTGKSFNLETINSDSVTKTFLLDQQKVGISNHGQDLLGGVPTASHIKKFSEESLAKEDTVDIVAQKLLDYFTQHFPGVDAGFHVAGYKQEGKQMIPHVYSMSVANKSSERKNIKADGSASFGATWSGQIDVLTGIIQPSLLPGPNGSVQAVQKAPIIWDAMALQDAIDFSVYAIRTTIDTIRFQARPKNVGGPIDVLVITHEKASWIQKKDLHV